MKKIKSNYVLKMNEWICSVFLSERHYNLKLLFDFDSSTEGSFVFLAKENIRFLGFQQESIILLQYLVAWMSHLPKLYFFQQV